MKALVVLLVLWTGVLVAALILTDPGSAPCPEATPVGLAEVERTRLLAECEERFMASAGVVARFRPVSWLVIWGAGAVILLVATTTRGRTTRPHRSRDW